MGLGKELKCALWNVRGCNKEEKREEISSVFKERKLDIVCLSETKLKGKGEVWFGNIKGVKSGVRERTRAREWVAILLRDEMWNFVIEWKEVSSRIIWLKLKIGRVLWFFVGVYAPGNEKSEEERDNFYENMDECVKDFSEKGQVVIMGYMNARVGSQVVEGVVGSFGVSGANEST